MSLIDASYFEVDIILPVAGSAVAGDAIRADVNKHISKYEPKFMRELLGTSLYEAFLVGLAANGGYFSPTDFDSTDFNTTGVLEDRWDWLLNGHTYPIGSNSYYWQGFVNEEKESVIAPYVYYWYRKNRRTTTQQSGETIAKLENSDVVSPRFKVSQVWNEMAKSNRELLYIIRNATNDDGTLIYPEYVHDYRKTGIFSTMNPFL